jgi:hypothetical protein
MTSRDAALNCTTGRGPAASDFAQTVQPRISSMRVMLFRTAELQLRS